MKIAEFKTFIEKRGRMLVIMFILIDLKLKVKLIFVFVMKTDLIYKLITLVKQMFFLNYHMQI